MANRQNVCKTILSRNAVNQLRRVQMLKIWSPPNQCSGVFRRDMCEMVNKCFIYPLIVLCRSNTASIKFAHKVDKPERKISLMGHIFNLDNLKSLIYVCQSLSQVFFKALPKATGSQFGACSSCLRLTRGLCSGMR